jgi:hypothetical protein
MGVHQRPFSFIDSKVLRERVGDLTKKEEREREVEGL